MSLSYKLVNNNHFIVSNILIAIAFHHPQLTDLHRLQNIPPTTNNEFIIATD